MDRDKLNAFLRASHRTFRWTDDGLDGYEAVETTDAGLVWFRWSHKPEDDGGGPLERRTQSFEDFKKDGPLRPSMPAEMRAALRALVESR